MQVKVHHRVNYTGGKFATGIIHTGSKFANGIIHTGGKFALNTTSVVDTGSNLPPVSMTPVESNVNTQTADNLM